MSLVGVFLATVAIFEAVRRWPQFVGVYDAKGLTLNSGMSIRAGFMRSLGPFTDPIAFSIFLAVSALALLGLLEARGGRRAIISACGVLTVCGLGFTFSRTGIVALCAGVAVFALLRRKMLHLVALGGVLGLGAFLFSAIAGVGSSSSAEYRLKLWEAGRDVILQNPIFGNNQAVDQGDLYQLVQGQGIVDLVNSYIQLGIQGGLVLILCFLAIPVAATARYLKHRARLLAESRLLGDVVQAQLAALLAGLAFTSLTDKNLLLVTLLAGLLAGVPANDKVLQKSRAALKHRKDRRPEGLVGAELVAQ
jgi:O-antigen ligase